MTSVLVVDGRPADRELLATVLGNAGYAAAEAATGEVAIAFARSQRPDLIITHILMPRALSFGCRAEVRFFGLSLAGVSPKIVCWRDAPLHR